LGISGGDAGWDNEPRVRVSSIPSFVYLYPLRAHFNIKVVNKMFIDDAINYPVPCLSRQLAYCEPFTLLFIYSMVMMRKSLFLKSGHARKRKTYSRFHSDPKLKQIKKKMF
jgi:hypothetical protein